MSYPTVNFQPTSPFLGLQPIADVASAAKHPIGTTVRATDFTYGEATFIYLKGFASTAAGDAVTYNLTTGATTRTLDDSSAIGSLGVAMSACGSNQYGWYAISGVVPVKSGTVVSGHLAFLSGTVAQLDDDADLYVVAGAHFRSAASGGFASLHLDHPSAIKMQTLLPTGSVLNGSVTTDRDASVTLNLG